MAEARDLSVSGLYRIPGGASRETWSFDARWNEGGREQRRGFILRRDPEASLLETERDVEYRVYRADSEAQLADLLRALPLYDWMNITVTPLGAHPNDPGPPATGAQPVRSQL